MSGYGASIYGARWNSRGVQMIYTAENRSLAMAEVLVHLSLTLLPDDFQMHTIEIPDDISMKTFTISELPEGWNIFPQHRFTQKVGDNFVKEQKHCLLKVPSVVTPGDFNILINPFHKEFEKIKIVDSVAFKFDNRLFK